MTLRAAAAVGAAFASFLIVSPCAANSCVQAATDAQELRSSGRLVAARAQLLVCAQKTCNSVVRSDCERWIKEVDEQTPSVIVRAVDARGMDVVDAMVTIDDAPITLDGNPVALDPGQHVVKARAATGDTMEQKVLVAQGEKGRIVEVRFDRELAQDGTRRGGAPEAPPKEAPPPPGRSSNVVPITLAAIGGAALVSFIVFEALGQSDYNDLQNTCGKTGGCFDSDIDPVKTKFVVAGISLGISAVALAAALVVVLTRKPSPPSTASLVPTLRF